MARHLSILVIAVLLGSSLGPIAGENIPLKELPKPVVEAIRTRFPKAELLKAERERDRGKEHFEVKILVKGKRYERGRQPGWEDSRH